MSPLFQTTVVYDHLLMTMRVFSYAQIKKKYYNLNKREMPFHILVF